MNPKLCDFCSEAVMGGGVRVEIRATMTPADGRAAFATSPLYVKLACEQRCVTNHFDGVDAGAVQSKRMLEATLMRDLGDAKKRIVTLLHDAAVADRGAVRYAARMVRHAAALVIGQGSALQGADPVPPRVRALAGDAVDEVYRLIENYAKRLDTLQEPQGQFRVEWETARRELEVRLRRETGARL
jgi:hypothetical protein